MKRLFLILAIIVMATAAQALANSTASTLKLLGMDCGMMRS